MKLRVTVALIVSVFFSSGALCEVKRLQVCASSCNTPFCKKVAEDVEFEFELLKDFLLPPCQKKLGSIPKKEFRLVISQEKNPDRIAVEVDCQGVHKCLSKEYPPHVSGSALTNKIITDVKLAIKHNKAIEAISSKVQVPPLPKTDMKKDTTTDSTPSAASVAEISLIVPKPESPTVTFTGEEEWDRVVLVSPTATSKEPEITSGRYENTSNSQVEAKHGDLRQPLVSASMSFGGENWNYNFESDADAQNNHPFHSRVYPKLLFSISYWALPYLRLTSNLSAAVTGFRLKTNQPVEGDGQVVIGQLYQSDVLGSVLLPLWKIVHVGVDAGYEFSSAFVDAQRVAERQLTVIPSYQSHGLRVGPRLIVGALTDKGMIDLGMGFYPYMHYFESPDEPTTSRATFAWSVEGGVRLMLGSEIFAEARVRTTTIHVHYEQEAIREGIEGEKWGPGRVKSMSAFATAGLGWSF